MKIDSEQYKLDLCTLTDDSCVGYDCCICEVATEHDRTMKDTIDREEETKYTIFESENNIRGIKVKTNNSNSIAKTDMATLKSLQDINIVSMQTVGYVPANFPCYAMNLRKLRQYNNLPIPDEIFAPMWPDLIPTVAAFRWGDVVYLIAPCVVET